MYLHKRTSTIRLYQDFYANLVPSIMQHVIVIGIGPPKAVKILLTACFDLLSGSRPHTPTERSGLTDFNYAKSSSFSKENQHNLKMIFYEE